MPAGVSISYMPGRGRVAEANRGRMLEPEIDHAHAAALPRRGAPHLDRRVVGVEHRRTALRQRAHERRVLLRDVGDALHELLMLALRIVDESHRRLRHRRELRGFSRMIHAELDRRCGVFGAQAQQRERQADRVVVVALRRERARLAEMGAQDSRQHFLDGGLAVAADDDDDGNREARAPMRREIARVRRASPAPRRDCPRSPARDRRRRAPRRHRARTPRRRNRVRRSVRP